MLDNVETHESDLEKVTTPPMVGIEQIGDRALRIVEETPPTKRPKNGEADSFWMTPGVLTQSGMVYGDIEVCAPSSDAHGTTCSYIRPILNESGQQIGKWQKDGYYKPNEDEAIWFQEQVNLNDDTPLEQVVVYLNRPTEKVPIQVGSVERVISPKPDYRPASIEELRYTYDYNNGGELLRIELVDKDPADAYKEIAKKIIFLKQTEQPNQKPDRTEAVASTESIIEQIGERADTSQKQKAPEASKPVNKGNLLSRLFHRK